MKTMSNTEKPRSRRDRSRSHVERSGFPNLHKRPPLSMCSFVADGGLVWETFPRLRTFFYNRDLLGGRSVTAETPRNAGVV